MSGSLISGIVDTRARDEILRLRSTIRELRQLIGTGQFNVAVSTSSGVPLYAALPPTTGYSTGQFIQVLTATKWALYVLATITSTGAVDWMPVTAKTFP